MPASADNPAGASEHIKRPRSVRLHRRRIYILPTRAGLAFAALLMAMLLGAVNYNNSLGHMLVFLLGSLALVGILHTWRNLNGLVLRGGRSAPVFAGEQAGLRLCIDNPGRAARYGLDLDYPGGDDGDWAERLEYAAASGQTCITLPLTSEHRGWLSLGRLQISSRYPLGLFRAWAHAELDLACLVYPRPDDETEMPRPQGGQDQDGLRQQQGHEDFAGFRGFQPGDSPRQVYWKGVARGQGMLVKLFSGGMAGDVELDWEQAHGDAEQRLSQLCAWVLEADRQGHRFRLRLPGEELGPDSGEAFRNRCLRSLALYGSV